MKIVSFRQGSKESYGVVVGDGVADMGAKLGKDYPTLRRLLLGHGLGKLADAAKGAKADHKLDKVTLLPVIPDAEKLICVGVNYDEHRMETGRQKSDYPVLFLRFADTQVGHGQPMIKPKSSERFDYEGELAVVIGKEGRNIPAARALEHVAGYACYNDGSVRDWQRHTHQFTPGKNFPATGAFGPWMVTADEIKDPKKLTLVTRLNGQEVQRAGTDMMIFDIPALIAYISGFTVLRPGDVIITGTPGGVGDRRTPPLYMKGGDTVEVEISGVGLLRNPIANE
ncbi:MAG TPA: fumarylacetoacetate hydrolase family protein [Candidatus Cybelea sp.]|nr:fumarylacetoacetate hydrolase family protein [Candidatus Cybelea sp.]